MAAKNDPAAERNAWKLGREKLIREVHTAHQIVKAGLGAQLVESSVDFHKH